MDGLDISCKTLRRGKRKLVIRKHATFKRAKESYLGKQLGNRKRPLNLGCPNTYLLLEKSDLVCHVAALIQLLFSGQAIIAVA